MTTNRAPRWVVLATPLALGAAAWLAAAILLMRPAAAKDASGSLLAALPDPSGAVQTFTPDGSIDTHNPFFQTSLGRNGQACVTCHQADQAWSITPAAIEARFDATDGLDPLFRLNDTANSPNADTSSVEARRAAYSLLLGKGLVRIVIPMPSNAEYRIESIQDPYGATSAQQLSLYRRPLPTTNMRFLSAVNWDGRSKLTDLQGQARGVVQKLLLGPAPKAAQLDQIVAFETSIFTAQVHDTEAGDLEARSAHGGPSELSRQPFFIGINDLFQVPDRAPFTPRAFTLYDAWAGAPDASARAEDGDFAAARRAVARGEVLFNTFPIAIKGVSGLNDLVKQPVIMGTCTTCHNTPNVGNHSVAAPLNIGVSDPARSPDLPVYTLRNTASGQVVQTTDPGRALITGKWADVGKFKGPILRGLAARAPYFHNGAAASLREVVDFYDRRFRLGLTTPQKEDLVAFLRTL